MPTSNPQFVYKKKYETANYAAGQTTRVRLEKANFLRVLTLTFAGVLTCSAANNTAANTARGDEWAAVNSVRVVVNGSDALVDMTGNELFMFNRYAYRRNPRISSQIGDATTLNPSFFSTIEIPFWSLHTLRSTDTLLDMGKTTDITLEIGWGTHLSINPQATGFTTAPTIQVASTESFFTLPFEAGKEFKASALRRTRRLVNVPNTGVFELDLTPGPVYRGFFINVRNIVTNVDNGSAIGNVTLYSSTTKYIDQVTFAELREMNELRDNIDRPIAATGLLNSRRGTANSQDAWLFIDLAEDNMLSEAIDSAGFGSLKLRFECNVAQAHEISVIPIEIYPIRKSA